MSENKNSPIAYLFILQSNIVKMPSAGIQGRQFLVLNFETKLTFFICVNINKAKRVFGLNFMQADKIFTSTTLPTVSTFIFSYQLFTKYCIDIIIHVIFEYT